MDVVAVARREAERLLASVLPRRWVHVQAVAAKAQRAAALIPEGDQKLVVAAAWLHDVGYSPELAVLGFHPLDGARWLRENGLGGRLAALVAHHSCACFEAQERGLADVLRDEFPCEVSITADVLWWADMTAGPDGQDFTVEERLADIGTRYGPNDAVSLAWVRARPVIVEVVQRVEAKLGDPQPM